MKKLFDKDCVATIADSSSNDDDSADGDSGSDQSDSDDELQIQTTTVDIQTPKQPSMKLNLPKKIENKIVFNEELNRFQIQNLDGNLNRRGSLSSRTITNSNIPKLPANATNAIYIVCLHIIFFYTKARDTYRQRDTKGDTVTLQLWLCVAAVIDLYFVMIMYNINWTGD